jgi:hypothetical protein
MTKGVGIIAGGEVYLFKHVIPDINSYVVLSFGFEL